MLQNYFTNCYRFIMSKARRLLTSTRSSPLEEPLHSDTQTMYVSNARDGVFSPPDEHAYKIAFVHDELDNVFRMRRRVEKYGKSDLTPRRFHVRTPSLTAANLEELLYDMNANMHSTVHSKKA